MTTTASEAYADVVLLHKLNIFQSWTFLIKIYNILKNNILTCFCWASVESWLLWRYASRSSLLYSGFRYTMELPLQQYKIQLYTFRVQGLAFFLPWFPDYRWCYMPNIKTLCQERFMLWQRTSKDYCSSPWAGTMLRWAIKYIGATTCNFQKCEMCDQQSLRSAWAYAQSDQRLCLSLEYSMTVKLLTTINWSY